MRKTLGTLPMNEDTEVQGSVVAIRKKLFSAHFAAVVTGSFLLALSFLVSGANWALALSLLALAFTITELLIWQFRPVLLIAPWGISHRRHAWDKLTQLSRDNIIGWSESSFEVVLNVAGRSAIKIPLADFRPSEAGRLTRSLRESGYKHQSVTYDGV